MAAKVAPGKTFKSRYGLEVPKQKTPVVCQSFLCWPCLSLSLGQPCFLENKSWSI